MLIKYWCTKEPRRKKKKHISFLSVQQTLYIIVVKAHKTHKPHSQSVLIDSIIEVYDQQNKIQNKTFLWKGFKNRLKYMDKRAIKRIY